MVLYGILAPKTPQPLAVVLQEERRLIFQHQMRHIVGQIKELSAGCGALQPDIATKELLVMQEKQYDKPRYLTLCTDLLS